MYQLLESIKCFNGELINLPYHQARFNLSRKAHFRPCTEISLAESVIIPEKAGKGLFKCRIIYSRKIEKIEFQPYSYRSVGSLKLVESNEIDYRYKYTQRQHLEQLFEKRGMNDDILIVKNGYISDSYMANVIFFDGKRWWTPDSPLLPGTQRARLIHQRKIFVCSITPGDLYKYKKAGLINAMQDMENMPVIDMECIFGS